MENKQASTAEQEIIDSVIEQVKGFEGGLNTVIGGALADGMQPLAIATACARSMIRVSASFAISIGMDDETFERMVREMIDVSMLDMRESYSQIAEQAAAAV